MRLSPAAAGWMVCLAVPAAYDAWALATGNETMSRFFWRHRDDRITRFFGVGAWMGLTWHLLLGDKRFLPEPVHNHYLRIHPLWALNGAVKKRAVGVIVTSDDLQVIST